MQKQPTTTAGVKRGYAYAVLIACTFAFFADHAGRQVVPPMLPLIADEFSLNYTMSGLYAACWEIGYAPSLLTGAYLTDRFGKKVVISAGLLWLALTLFLGAFAASYTQLVILRILSGFTMGMYFAGGTSLIALYFESSERGRALGIHTAGMGAGRTLTPVLVGLTIMPLGWRPQFFFVAAVALLAALVFWKVVQEPGTAEGVRKVSGWRNIKAVVRNRDITILGWVALMLVSVYFGVASYLAQYLKDVFGTGLRLAGLSVAILNVLGIPGNIVFGLLSDRWGRRTTLMVNLAVGGIALYFFSLLKPGAGLIAGITILGLFLGTGWGALIAFVADKVVEVQRAAAIGWFNTINASGLTILILFGGVISDLVGIENVFFFYGTISLVGALSVLAVSEEKSWLKKASGGASNG